MLRYTYIACLV